MPLPSPALTSRFGLFAAMVPPFEVSLFADPGGSFTTAAAMVACVERALKRTGGHGLKGLRCSVFGATGVVGFASAVIAASEGAKVRIVAHDDIEQVISLAALAKSRADLQRRGAMIVTPEQAAEAIRAYCAEQPITRFYGWTIPPGLPPEWADEHVELMAREVIPEFRRQGA